MEIMQNGKNVQTYIKALFSDVVKADLRALQAQVRVSEYYKIIKIVDVAEQNGLDATTLRRAAELLNSDVYPYTETKSFSAPEIMMALVKGLSVLIDAYGEKDPELLRKYKQTLDNYTAQKNDMLKAVQSGVAPQKMLFLTNNFLNRFRRCADYNASIANAISGEFAAENMRDLLLSTTAYLVMLDFGAKYATLLDGSLPLFAFKQSLKTLTDPAGNAKVVHVVFDADGIFYESMLEENKASFERQRDRYDAIWALHERLTQLYISDLVRAAKPAIRSYYARNSAKTSKFLLTQVASKMRDSFERNLFGALQKKFANIIIENKRWVSLSIANNENFVQESPINVMLSDIEHNRITSTKSAKIIHAAFLQNLKIIVNSDSELKQIFMTPEMKIRNERMKIRNERIERRNAQVAAEQEALRVTDIMQIDEATALTNTLGLELDEVRDEFQALRQENVYKILVSGDFILTEENFLKFNASYPVIQVERKMAGSIIVGSNEAAHRMGFVPNLYIAQMQRVSVEDINVFLEKERPSERPSEVPKMTRFTVVMLGRRKQDVNEEEMLDEALNDTEMLDEEFLDSL